MKNLITTTFLLAVSLLTYGQIEEGQFIKMTTSFERSLQSSSGILNALKGTDKPAVINALSADDILRAFIGPFVTAINDGNPHYGLIIVYRDLKEGVLDPNSSKTFIYHRQNNWYGAGLSNYFLETRNLKIIFIDLDDKYYNLNAEADRLSNTKIHIDYRESFFKKSITALTGVLGTMSGPKKGQTEDLIKFTLVEIEPKRVKAPCTLVLSNKSFTSDLKFEIHERNVASAQIGLVNSKFAINNFSISDGNLIVEPDSTQKEEWKSNLYAVLEFHLPRDVDNFQPLWKELFKRPEEFKDHTPRSGKLVADWFFRNTIHRMGIYGGLKISEDPLSNLYAGFNYAITKELYVNFGWIWSNEITPQVTEIGNITSVDEALQYAKRSYAEPQFSIGLSFSPGSVITMLGLKEKSSE